MSEIPVIGNPTVGAPRQMTPTVAPVEVVAPEVTTSTVDGCNAEVLATTDRVEFSQQSQLLEKIHNLPEVRQDKIDAIKEAVDNNSYLTPEKLDIAVNRMIGELLG